MAHNSGYDAPDPRDNRRSTPSASEMQELWTAIGDVASFADEVGEDVRELLPMARLAWLVNAEAQAVIDLNHITDVHKKADPSTRDSPHPPRFLKLLEHLVAEPELNERHMEVLNATIDTLNNIPVEELKGWVEVCRVGGTHLPNTLKLHIQLSVDLMEVHPHLRRALIAGMGSLETQRKTGTKTRSNKHRRVKDLIAYTRQ